MTSATSLSFRLPPQTILASVPSGTFSGTWTAVAVIRYHNAVGPTALCAALLFGVVLNFAFESRDRQLW